MQMATIDQDKLWGDTLARIETDISKASFATWFKNTAIHKYEDGTIIVSVPNAFVKDWLKNKYHSCILRALRVNLETIRALEYTISKQNKEGSIQSREEGRIVTTPQLNMGELYVNKEDNLNNRLTFDSYIVGPFNELAHAASQAVIKNPGISYNPLYIYGGTGLGKTHMIQAIGNHFKRIDQNKKVHYLSTEKFTVELVDSIKNNKAALFKEKYRRYDVLIMDDVQFLSGKEKTQEELFHLFNALYDKNKQIIFSSDKAPKQISGIEDRLKSRFEGGMIADITAPEYESRLAILREKVRQCNVDLPEETLEYVASVIQHNIRELEGVLNLIIIQTGLKKRDLLLGEIKQLIKNSIKPTKNISINDVITTISSFYNVAEQELYDKTRKKEVVKPRQIVMYILREDFNTSYPYIGQKLGGRDHTTVIHAYEKIKADIQRDDLLAQEIEQIKTLLYGNS